MSDKKMKEVRVAALKYFDKTPTEVYLLKSDNFVKLFEKDDIINKEEMQKHEKEGTNFLHIKKEDRTVYMNYLKDKIDESILSEQVGLEKKVNLIKESSEQILRSIFDMGAIELEAFEHAKELSEKIIKLAASDRRAIDLLIDVEGVDVDTLESSLATSFLSLVFLEKLNINCDRTKEITALGGLFHDVGKALIPFEILNKPGKLTAQERKEIEKHSHLGARMLEQTDIVCPEIVQITLQHHEEWNGKGYPNGTKGEDIYLLARLISIIDVFTALITPRVYKSKYSVHRALEIMLEMRGKFDPNVLRLFVSVFKGGEYYMRQVEEIYELEPFTEEDIECFMDIELFNLEKKTNEK